MLERLYMLESPTLISGANGGKENFGIRIKEGNPEIKEIKELGEIIIFSCMG